MRLPAEWERQSGVQLTWPHCDTEWYQLDRVLECYVDIAINIVRFERLLIVCRDIDEAKADISRVCGRRGWSLDMAMVTFCQAPLNDTWARDHGGISVYGDEGEKYLYDFVFNGWGLKFASDLDNQLTKNIFSQGVFEDDVTGADMRPFVLEGGSIDTDGHGTLLTTTECLTSVNRNEYMTRDEIESELKQYFGLDRVLWLDHGGIIGDDTDGHVDTLARFCSPDTIAYVQCTDDYRLPASYANFLIVNGGVLVPGSGSEKDEVARRLLQEVFPDREVVVIDCRALLSGHGSLHCVTMQFPEGWLRTE